MFEKVKVSELDVNFLGEAREGVYGKVLCRRLGRERSRAPLFILPPVIFASLGLHYIGDIIITIKSGPEVAVGALHIIGIKILIWPVLFNRNLGR